MSMSTDDLEDPFVLLGEEGEEGRRLLVDTLVERRDLGPESYTLVAAGSEIPKHLAHLPTRPAAEPEPEPDSTDTDTASSKAKTSDAARATKAPTKAKPKADAQPDAPAEASPEPAEPRDW